MDHYTRAFRAQPAESLQVTRVSSVIRDQKQREPKKCGEAGVIVGRA